jgi:hypothetical protein
VINELRVSNLKLGVTRCLKTCRSESLRLNVCDDAQTLSKTNTITNTEYRI